MDPLTFYRLYFSTMNLCPCSIIGEIRAHTKRIILEAKPDVGEPQLREETEALIRKALDDLHRGGYRLTPFSFLDSNERIDEEMKHFETATPVSYCSSSSGSEAMQSRELLTASRIPRLKSPQMIQSTRNSLPPPGTKRMIRVAPTSKTPPSRIPKSTILLRDQQRCY